MVLRHGKNCPICNGGYLDRVEREEPFWYRGEKIVISNYPIYVCNNCSEELINASEVKEFEKDLDDFRKQIDILYSLKEG